MTDQAFTRRTSYGPTSPTIGSRGARTRQQIVDAALACFTEQGFHATSVEDIAVSASTSRATLYQYFESKEAIFVELMYESGGELVRLLTELGALGPTVEGFDHLQRYLAEFGRVFDHYSSMFVEWANVNSPKAPLRPKLARYVDYHAEHMGASLRDSGYEGDETVAAILVLAVIGRFHYIRHVYSPGLADFQTQASLAIAIQRYLFPDTSAAVLRRLNFDGPLSGEVPAPIAEVGPLSTLPARDSIDAPNPFANLRPQAAATVRELLDAAGRVFAANGYEATNIDQIVTEAGLARGTFYRYFSDKLELITTLAHEAAEVMCPLFDEFGETARTLDDAGLDDWLRRFLATNRRYSGVMRAWTEGFPISPQVLAPCSDVVVAMSRAIMATFGPPRRYPFERRAAGMLFAGLLEHFPNEATGCVHEPTDDQLIGAQAQFLRRVLLGA